MSISTATTLDASVRLYRAEWRPILKIVAINVLIFSFFQLAAIRLTPEEFVDTLPFRYDLLILWPFLYFNSLSFFIENFLSVFFVQLVLFCVIAFKILSHIIWAELPTLRFVDPQVQSVGKLTSSAILSPLVVLPLYAIASFLAQRIALTAFWIALAITENSPMIYEQTFSTLVLPVVIGVCILLFVGILQLLPIIMFYERRDLRSGLRRSWQLARYAPWRVFATLIGIVGLCGLLQAIPQTLGYMLLLEDLFSLMSTSVNTGLLLFEKIVTVVTFPLPWCFLLSLYVALRRSHEQFAEITAADQQQQRFLAAVDQLSTTNPDAALDQLKEREQNRPNDSHVLSRILHIHCHKQQYAEALPYAERLVTLEPENVQFLVWRGTILQQQGDLKNAWSDYVKARKLAPYDTEVLVHLAFFFIQQNAPNEACSLLLQILHIDRSYHWAHYQLARIYMRQGAIDQALEALTTAVERSPDFKTQLADEADFAPLRTHPQFVALLP
jgi:tetratricopeptide (TPR) repeat protein